MNALLSMVRTGGDEIASLLINKQQNEGSKEGGRGALFFNEMILFLFLFFVFFSRLITVLDHPNHHYSTVNVNVIFKVKVLLLFPAASSIVLKFHAPKMSLNRQLIKHCHR